MLVAVTGDPSGALLVGARMVRPGGRVAIAVQSASEVAALCTFMGKEGPAPGLLSKPRVTTLWHRRQQVLPNRTHPVVRMNGHSLYLMACVVQPSGYTAVAPSAKQVASERAEIARLASETNWDAVEDVWDSKSVAAPAALAKQAGKG